MIETLVLFGHLLVAALIIALVLLQRGKGAEAGTGFGAGASGTVFGSRGSASFFSRATAVLAGLFFATSLALAYFSSQAPTVSDSMVDGAGSGSAVIDAIDDEMPVGDDVDDAAPAEETPSFDGPPPAAPPEE